VCLALAAVLGLSPGRALAHLGHIVLRAERYLKIEASDAGARVVVSLSLGPDEARRVLEAADANGDATVSRAEADAYLADWGRGLLEDLPVELDGAPVTPTWGDAFFDPIGPIGDVPATVEMVGRIPLEGGRHRIAVADRMRREAFDRTDVAFRARERARLVASGAEESPADRVDALAYGPELAGDDLVLTALFELPEASGAASPSSPTAIALTLLAVGVLVGLLVLVVRRAKR
jgi:hypothetical protein